MNRSKPTEPSHEKHMGHALRGAAAAGRRGEVPIGAVLVKDGKIIARAANLTRTNSDPTAHAEIVLIQKAVRLIKNERFLNTALYVTLEPCAMCAGAIVQARIPLVVYGARDPRAGACGSVFRVLPNKKLNHRPVVIKQVRAEECGRMLVKFFKQRRKKRL